MELHMGAKGSQRHERLHAQTGWWMSLVQNGGNSRRSQRVQVCV